MFCLYDNGMCVEHMPHNKWRLIRKTATEDFPRAPNPHENLCRQRRRRQRTFWAPPAIIRPRDLYISHLLGSTCFLITGVLCLFLIPPPLSS